MRGTHLVLIGVVLVIKATKVVVLDSIAADLA